MRRKIIFILPIVCLIAIGSFFFRKETPLPVKVIEIKKESITSILNATGKVVSDHRAEVCTSVSARARTVFFKEGARVKQGTLLAIFESDDLEAKTMESQESMRQADEKVRRLQRDYRALQRVFEVGGTSKQSVEDAGSALKIAMAEAKKISLRLQKQKKDIARLEVRAPFSGIVTARDVEPGEWAKLGTPVFTMEDSASRAIEILVDESDASLVRVGQSVELTSDAFPGRRWEEHVVFVAPAVKKQESENSVQVRLSYGAQAPRLKLSQQVDAKIQIAHRDNIVKVPFNCITYRDGKPFVATVRNGFVHYHAVVTGIEDMTSIEVVKGIAVGEKVVITEGKPVKEGQNVRALR